MPLRKQSSFVGKQKAAIGPRRANCPYNLRNMKPYKYKKTSHTAAIEANVIQQQHLQEEGTGKYLALCSFQILNYNRFHTFSRDHKTGNVSNYNTYANYIDVY